MPPRRRRPPRAGALTELPPLRILRSIALLQIFYYATAFILLLFTVLVFGHPFFLGLIFDWTNIRRDNALGWLIAVIWLLVGFLTVIPILLLVARSKLVPDFALTIHFLHLIVVSVYTRSLPTNPLWWALQLASSALMVSLGVWACRYREMQPISFPTLPRTQPKNEGSGSAGGGVQAYEMVSQRDEESGGVEVG